MPRTNLCKPKEDRREKETKAVIAAGRARGNLTIEALAKKVKIPASTLSARLRDPRQMRLGELWDILDYLKTEDVDKAKIL